MSVPHEEEVREWVEDAKRYLVPGKVTYGAESTFARRVLALAEALEGPSGNLSVLVVGNPVDGVRFYGPFTYPEDADRFAEAELRNQEWWSVELHRP
jgi:hypothetical protein